MSWWSYFNIAVSVLFSNLGLQHFKNALKITKYGIYFNSFPDFYFKISKMVSLFGNKYLQGLFWKIVSLKITWPCSFYSFSDLPYNQKNLKKGTWCKYRTTKSIEFGNGSGISAFWKSLHQFWLIRTLKMSVWLGSSFLKILVLADINTFQG